MSGAAGAVLVAALAGCDGSTPTSASASGAGAGIETAALVAALAARAADEAAGAAVDDGRDGGAGMAASGTDSGRSGSNGPPTWPADLDLHPDAPAESIELLAVLGERSGARWSLARRFDRVAVRPASGGTLVGGDDFAFRDVLRLGGAIEPLRRDGAAKGAVPDDGSDRGGTASRREALERVTLGLAAAGPRRVQVRDAALAMRRSSGSDEPCSLDYRLDEADGIALRFAQTACPLGGAGGPIALATSPTLAASGTLVVDGTAHEVAGRGWVRRAWGALPAPGGAVVFDRLLLELDGAGLLEVERSKRRSGRGPRTSGGRLRSPGEEAAIELDAIDWRDGATSDDVPGRWEVAIPDEGIDVVLEPLADVADAVARGTTEGAAGTAAFADDGLGRRWLGAVRASGSHEGVGFVEFVPTDETEETP